uniref:Uncharacterized protein n=1 Tax=Siphoviridae sp. ct5jB2 TaxID=2825337 RepID=A0A8S5TTF9_9CAUD|nr:MAG TPA: hypothetical protein [Siphoviridae sp. ct5jB2]
MRVCEKLHTLFCMSGCSSCFLRCNSTTAQLFNVYCE